MRLQFNWIRGFGSAEYYYWVTPQTDKKQYDRDLDYLKLDDVLKEEDKIKFEKLLEILMEE